MSAVVKITRAKDDPLCLRVSIGGGAEMGYYLVYRGPRAECLTAMKACVDALESLDADPEVDQKIPPIPIR